jgi:hypothetical protein
MGGYLTRSTGKGNKRNAREGQSQQGGKVTKSGQKTTEKQGNGVLLLFLSVVIEDGVGVG